jgi:hypothetical protein
MRLLAGLLTLGLVPSALGQAINFGNGAAVGTNLTVSTLTTGSVLNVGAAVSADGRYVTMNMHPEFSALEGIDTFSNIGAAAGGNAGVNGGVNPFFANGMARAAGLAPIPFRPAVVDNVTFVETDKKLLATPVPAMTLADTTLKQAVRKLADATKQNLVLGTRALEQAGVDPGQKHTFVLGAEEGTLKKALLALLREAAPNVEMVISAEENVVQVTTQAAADNQMVTKLYYLEDLIARLPRIVSAKTDLGTLREDGGAAGGSPARPGAGISLGAMAIAGSALLSPGGATSLATDVVSAPVDGPTTRPANREVPLNIKKPYATDIVELITSTVRPEIWKNHGGKYAEVTVSGNRVMVRAPASVQAILDGPKVYNPNAVPMYLNYGTR